MPYRYSSEEYNYKPPQRPEDEKNIWKLLKKSIPGLIMLCIFPPVGIFLLVREFLKYMSDDGDIKPRRGKNRNNITHIYEESAQNGYVPKTGAYSYQSSTASGAYTAQRQSAQPKQPKEPKQTKVNRGQENEARYTTQIPYYTAPGLRKPKGGKAMTVWGGILAGCFAIPTFVCFLILIFGYASFPVLLGMSICGGFTAASLMLAIFGNKKTQEAKRFNRYSTLVGRNTQVPLTTLFEAVGVSYRQGCDDLQKMLDSGYLPTGYLDLGRGMLVFGTEGMQFDADGFQSFVKESEERLKTDEEQHKADLDEYQKLVAQIRTLNDAIAHVEMSRKIDRIEEITRRIFNYVKTYPDKKGQLNHFFSYYLPTTLNLLERYAQLEAQGVEGENITAAKERIEGMMDKVVEGYEKQLDQLFAGTAMDISADVAVLERMLQKDGLSDGGYTMSF